MNVCATRNVVVYLKWNICKSLIANVVKLNYSAFKLDELMENSSTIFFEAVKGSWIAEYI